MAKKLTIDNLGIMVKHGFDEIDNNFKEMRSDFKEMRSDIKEMRSDIKGLKQGQENIELKLSNVAYRFELEEIKQRVIMLEKKIGVK